MLKTGGEGGIRTLDTFDSIPVFECGVVNTNKAGFSKIITIANVIDEKRFQQIMSAPKMVEWDQTHNNTDVIYSLERIN